jgi:hypothetical protein
MANKITKREVISTMLADETIKANEMYVAYLKHELELLDKKAQKKGKSDEELAEIERLKSLVVGALQKVGKGTVSEIQKADEELAELSNQKVTSLLGALKKEEVVIRATEGRKTVFYLA